MRQLVMHSLKMHKVQAVSIAASVALSAMIFVTFGLIYGGVQQGIETSEAQNGADIMAVPTDAMQYIDDTELLYTGAPAAIYMDACIVEDLADVEGAIAVSPQFYGQTLNSGCCSTTGETRLIGIDPETDFIVSGLTSKETVGELGDHEIIVGSAVGGVYENQLTIYDEKYTVVGVMAETGTGFDSSIVANIELVRDLSRDLEGYEHYWEKYGDPDDLVSCVMIDIDDENRESAIQAVQARINLSGTASPLVQTDVVDKASSQMQSVFLLLLAAVILMSAVTLLQLFARFYSSVWDRKREMALYRAIGASKSDLRKLIASEMGILVVAGLVMGIVLGFVFEGALLGVMQEGLAFPYLALGAGTSALLVAGVVIVFLLVGLVSVIVPLCQIGHLDPSAAMQQGDID